MNNGVYEAKSIKIAEAAKITENIQRDVNIALVNELSKMSAVQEGHCYVVDGNQYFTRPGPRIADTCEIIASILYPDKFPALVKLYQGSAYTTWRPT